MAPFPCFAATASELEGKGAGASYWGEIPARTEAGTVAPDARKKPAWEYIVDAPLYIGFLPVRWTMVGVENTAEFVNESGALRRLLGVFPLRVGPAYLSGGFSVGSQDGFGGNLSLDVPKFFGRRNAMKIRGSASQEGAGKAIAGVRLYDGSGALTEIGGGYRGYIDALYYGLGSESREDSESLFREEMGWIGISHHRPFRNDDFWWEVSALYSGVSATGSPDLDKAPLADVFAGELPPGYRDRSDGAGLSLELGHDNTTRIGPPGRGWREAARPERGGIRRAKVSWFRETTDLDISFWTWRGEIQQFFPLWFNRRALAVRGFLSRIENEGNEPVPFQRMLTNDDPDLFRGYPDYRFRDLGIGAVSAEYRWPVWASSTKNGPGVDAYAFIDYGQVFGAFSEIETDRMTASWGGGFRAGGYGRFVGRVEVGKSEEDVMIRFEAGQVFQYAKGGLFQGRNPVPER